MKDEFYYYSRKLGGFIWSGAREIYEEKGDFPSDCVEISTKYWQALLIGQSAGKQIVSDKNGYPILKDPQIDYVAKAEARRAALRAEANKVTADWRTELQLGMIDDADKAQLTEWMGFLKQLKGLDFSGIKTEADYNALEWPEKPVATV